MKTEMLSLTIDGIEVKGKITRHEKYHLEVEILHPYVNWKSYRSISPVILRGSPNPFLNRWKELSEEILTNSYEKLKMIDERIDNLTIEYNNLTEDIIELENIQKKEIKERIVKKLNDWFYHNHIFVSSVTGMIATISDRPQIEEIIKVYKAEKKKIYLKKDAMSLKKPFNEMDIQMLSQKVRRLEYWFKEDASYITDERLDNYNLLKKRIIELIKNQDSKTK